MAEKIKWERLGRGHYFTPLPRHKLGTAIEESWDKRWYANFGSDVQRPGPKPGDHHSSGSTLKKAKANAEAVIIKEVVAFGGEAPLSSTRNGGGKSAPTSRDLLKRAGFRLAAHGEDHREIWRRDKDGYRINERPEGEWQLVSGNYGAGTYQEHARGSVKEILKKLKGAKQKKRGTRVQMARKRLDTLHSQIRAARKRQTGAKRVHALEAKWIAWRDAHLSDVYPNPETRLRARQQIEADLNALHSAAHRRTERPAVKRTLARVEKALRTAMTKLVKAQRDLTAAELKAAQARRRGTTSSAADKRLEQLAGRMAAHQKELEDRREELRTARARWDALR